MKRKLLIGLVTGLVVFGACSDDNDEDASNTETSEAAGKEKEETPVPLTGLDTTFGQAGVKASPLSPTEDDRFLAITAGPAGSFYVAGWTSTGEDHSMILAKLGADGAPDQSFGAGGVATVNVVPGGKAVEVARAVVVQSDGKVVISGPVEHDPKADGVLAKDNDIALVRFDPAGKPDPTFGKDGIAVIDLGKGKALADGSFVADNSWGLVSLPDNKLVQFGSTPAPGHNDADFALVGLTSAGVLDPAFGTQGRLTVDLNRSGDSPRNLILQPDGKLVAAGYSKDSAGVVNPVLIRATTDGKLDPAFGDAGVATAAALPGGVVEAYSLGLVGQNYVTIGYGHGANPDEKVDVVSTRFTNTGQWDKTYGTDGLVRFDLAAEDDRGRNMKVLPDGTVLVIGVGTPAADASDAMLMLLDGNGVPVKTFGTDGHLLSDLGGPSDAWFSGALSSDGKSVMVVGYKGVDPEGEGNDDAAVARLKL